MRSIRLVDEAYYIMKHPNFLEPAYIDFNLSDYKDKSRAENNLMHLKLRPDYKDAVIRKASVKITWGEP